MNRHLKVCEKTIRPLTLYDKFKRWNMLESHTAQFIQGFMIGGFILGLVGMLAMLILLEVAFVECPK